MLAEWSDDGFFASFDLTESDATVDVIMPFRMLLKLVLSVALVVALLVLLVMGGGEQETESTCAPGAAHWGLSSGP